MKLFRNKDSLQNKAKEVNEVLECLGLYPHTESGKQIRQAIAMELIGQKYDVMEKHSKATFVKQHGPVLEQVREMLIQDGVLSRPAQQLDKKRK